MSIIDDWKAGMKLVKNKIRVCHLTSAHKRYDQRILYRQCVSLQQNGYTVTLVVNDTLDDEVYNLQNGIIQEKDSGG